MSSGKGSWGKGPPAYGGQGDGQRSGQGRGQGGGQRQGQQGSGQGGGQRSGQQGGGQGRGQRPGGSGDGQWSGGAQGGGQRSGGSGGGQWSGGGAGDQRRPQEGGYGGGGRGQGSWQDRRGSDNQGSSSSAGPGYRAPTASFGEMNIGGGRSQGGGGGGQGFRGGSQGRGRGAGGGRNTGTPHNSDLPLSYEKRAAPFQYNSRWKNLPAEKDDIELPARKDLGKEFSKMISIRANHYPINIKFPKMLYHYEVEKIVAIRKPKAEEAASAEKPTSSKKGKKGKQPPKKEEESSAGATGEPPRFIRLLIHQELTAILERKYEAANPGKVVGIASDKSKALYSTAELGESISLENEVIIRPDGVDGNEEKYVVTLKETTENIDTTALQGLISNMYNKKAPPALVNVDRVYNTVLKNLKELSYTPIGRSSLICFTKPGHPLGGGLLNFTGYDVTIGISGNWKPFVNIHYANCAAIMDKNVITVLADLFGYRDREDECKSIEGWRDEDFKNAKSLLASCKVQYQPFLNQRKILSGTITDFSNRSITENTFMLNENGQQRKVSVYQYYKEKYGRKDLNPNGPCLILNKKNQVPAELCVVKKGQSINRSKKLDGNQTKNMLNCAKKDPQELKPIIDNAISALKLKSDKVMKAFGISFESNTQMIQFDKTRLIAPPDICYGPNEGKKNMRITPDNGLWDSWRLNAKFLEPTKIPNWGILITCKGFRGKPLMPAASNFIGWMTRKGNLGGLQIGGNPVVKELILRDGKSELSRNVRALGDIFDKTFKGCTIVIVVIPSKGCELYTHVKQAAELYSGMLTQCILSEKFDPSKQNMTESIVGNILLKINSKVGGINHVVEAPRGLAKGFTIFEEPVMILGADVTHPPPDFSKEESEQISYAAVTCSINRSGMPFMMHVQAQSKAGKGAAEIVENLDVIVKKCLLMFQSKTNLKPTKIFYYRDGVGEGQFPELLHKEMRQIRAGCKTFTDDFAKPYEPAITFITVQKRHKTRFIPDQNCAVSNNAPPGTVVDTQIVHPRENDFFLLSHYGAMGTSRPTRYHVLWDDSDLSSDTIQQLTYYLCYMYVRCNRSVSIPAPTYYAHWAAARAKILAEGLTGSKATINQKLQRPGIYEKYPMHFI